MLGDLNKLLFTIILVGIAWSIWTIGICFDDCKYTPEEIERLDKNNMLARPVKSYGPIQEKEVIDPSIQENVLSFWNFDDGLTARANQGIVGQKITVCDPHIIDCLELEVIGRVDTDSQISIPRDVFSKFGDPQDGAILLTILGAYE